MSLNFEPITTDFVFDGAPSSLLLPSDAIDGGSLALDLFSHQDFSFGEDLNSPDLIPIEKATPVTSGLDMDRQSIDSTIATIPSANGIKTGTNRASLDDQNILSCSSLGCSHPCLTPDLSNQLAASSAVNYHGQGYSTASYITSPEWSAPINSQSNIVLQRFNQYPQQTTLEGSAGLNAAISFVEFEMPNGLELQNDISMDDRMKGTCNTYGNFCSLDVNHDRGLSSAPFSPQGNALSSTPSSEWEKLVQNIDSYDLCAINSINAGSSLDLPPQFPKNPLYRFDQKSIHIPNNIATDFDPSRFHNAQSCAESWFGPTAMNQQSLVSLGSSKAPKAVEIEIEETPITEGVNTLYTDDQLVLAKPLAGNPMDIASISPPLSNTSLDHYHISRESPPKGVKRRERKKPQDKVPKRKTVRNSGGACGPCSEKQKSRCGFASPCEPCIKRALCDISIAQRICSRPNERVVKVRSGIKDFFRMKTRRSHTTTAFDFRRIELHQLDLLFPSQIWKVEAITDSFKLESLQFHPITAVESRSSEPRKLELSLPPLVIGNSIHLVDGPTFVVDVEYCFDNRSYFREGRSKTRLGYTHEQKMARKEFFLRHDLCIVPIGNDEHQFEDQPYHELNGKKYRVDWLRTLRQYRIVSSSMPSIKELVEWGSSDMMQRFKLFPNNVEIALDVFLSSYIKYKLSLPLCDLVERILTITILGRYLDERRPVEYDRLQNFMNESGDANQRHLADISLPAKDQFFAQAVKGIGEIEPTVLEDLDHLVYNKRKGRSWEIYRSDPIILGLCVRRLSLHYRHTMKRYKRFSPLVAARYENARNMYDTTTRHYSRVFDGTLSPFHEEWELENHKDAFDNNDDLIAKFQQLKIAEAHHYNQDLDKSDDGVYLGLFVNRKDRKGRCPAKYWSAPPSNS